MEAIERVLELEPTSFNTRGRLSQILGVPERGRYKFSHEIWVYTAGETGFAVADNGYFSTAIARFAELLDLGPEDMPKIVTDEVLSRSDKEARVSCGASQEVPLHHHEKERGEPTKRPG